MAGKDLGKFCRERDKGLRARRFSTGEGDVKGDIPFLGPAVLQGAQKFKESTRRHSHINVERIGTSSFSLLA